MAAEQINILLQLICAHLLGDFVFQPSAQAKQKEEKGWKASFLYVHAGIHGLLAFLVIAHYFNWQLAGSWQPIVGYTALIILTHFSIDGSKVTLQKVLPHPKTLFLLDQLLHLLVIFALWSWMLYGTLYLEPLSLELSWVTITAYLFVTTPASITIKVLISHWKLGAVQQETTQQGIAQEELTQQATAQKKTVQEATALEIEEETAQENGLFKAGAWIGVLERLLILTFIISNHWEAVGFLLAAKSVFRFGDLRNSKEVHLTEYILIGTLMSFGFAIMAGILVNYLA